MCENNTLLVVRLYSANLQNCAIAQVCLSDVIHVSSIVVKNESVWTRIVYTFSYFPCSKFSNGHNFSTLPIQEAFKHTIWKRARRAFLCIPYRLLTRRGWKVMAVWKMKITVWKIIWYGFSERCVPIPRQRWWAQRMSQIRRKRGSCNTLQHACVI